MSYQATEWAVRQRAGGTGPKAVLMVLAEHADKRGLAYPTTRTIADEAECDQRSARRYLEALRERGLVAWTPGAGRGSNRYQLPVVRQSGASQGDGSEASRCLTTDGVVRQSGASQRQGSSSRSEAPGDRSEAVDHRSEAGRASDQQEREQNRYIEPVTTEPGAPPPHAHARGGGRPRERVSPAALNATAHRPAATVIVGDWLTANPGMTGPAKRELRKAVDTLLGQGADPDLVPAALDEAHGNPRWQHPARALGAAYEHVRRAAHQAHHAHRPALALAPEPGTATLRANAFLALQEDPR